MQKKSDSFKLLFFKVGRKSRKTVRSLFFFFFFFLFSIAQFHLIIVLPLRRVHQDGEDGIIIVL